MISRIILVALGFTLPTLSGAQGESVLTGGIIDTAGAPIVGASVRVPQLDRGVAADSAATNRLEELQAGRVTIGGEAPGFAGKRAEVTVPATCVVEQNFSLAPNAHVLANIEVRARARRQLPLYLHEVGRSHVKR